MSLVDYRNIRSIEQLRGQRVQVSNRIDLLEHRLQETLHTWSDRWSIAGMAHRLSTETEKLISWIEWGIRGYDFIRSLVTRYQAARKAAHAPQ